ncbi:uncharacterized protein BDV17DRAFT_293114 [Aspergillus undulatus]|uniref:uncharacterized protein n=1 Tax=Aspergillus undulatus TaxID=1810928 RepID=UPI003CCD5BC4
MLPTKILAALALCAPSLVTAQECTMESAPGGTHINSTQEARDLFAGCTTIIGSGFYLSDNFTGTLSLPGITNITGHMGGGTNTGDLAIEMPDLQYLGGIYSMDTNISRAYFPELISIEYGLSVERANDNVQLLFPKLTSVPHINIRSLLDFAALETVLTNIGIEFCPDCSSEDIAALDLIPALSFPSLQSARFIDISGTFSEIEFPALISAGSPNVYNYYRDDAGIKIQSGHSGLELSFPQLEVVDNKIDLSGSIMGLELPSLLQCHANLILNASTPLKFELPMQSSGLVELASMPSLNKVDRENNVWIFSQSISCSALGPGFQDSRYYKDNCVIPRREPETEKVKIIVGVVVPTVVVMFVVGVGIWYKRRGRRGEKKAVAEVELVGLDAEGSERVATASEEVRAPELERTQRERSRTPPPPYEARQS